MSENADYERGWRAAIDAISPPDAVDRANLLASVAGMNRRVLKLVEGTNDAWLALAGDLERVGRGLKRLGVDDPPNVSGPDIEQDRDRLLALLGDVAGALQLALDTPVGGERKACERILARAREALS